MKLVVKGIPAVLILIVFSLSEIAFANARSSLENKKNGAVSFLANSLVKTSTNTSSLIFLSHWKKSRKTHTFEEGPYIGVGAGFGKLNWKIIEGFNGVKVDHDDGNGAGRIVFGYDITRYFALEMGYTCFLFNNPTWRVLSNNAVIDQIKTTYAIDFSSRLTVPINKLYDVYCRIGASFLVTDTLRGDSISRKRGNIVYGTGIDYYINRSFTLNVEWMRFGGKASFGNPIDKKSDYQPDADAFLIGLRYKLDL
jgi:opacity protein-like surface antigen